MNYNDYLKQFHNNDKEFHQAVHEVVEDVAEFYKSNEQFTENNILERMIEPDRIIRFRVTWQDDAGNIQVNRAWRVQFNNALGAYKGGLRFHPTVNESVLKFLGFEQCFKNALTGQPMGGAKGGSDFDPKGRSDHEVRRFCESLMQELQHHIGAQVDVPAGDINVGTREIGYLFGHYLKLNNRWEGVITGKSPNFGGSCGREEATGYGVVYFLREMLAAHDHDLEGKTVLISGAGNVALHAAEKCLALGATVLTLSDSGGTLYFEDGMTDDDLKTIKKEKLQNRKRLEELDLGTFRKDKHPWGIAADIALPCATQNEMDEEEAQTLVENKVIAVAEGANMPLTSAAQKVLIDSHVLYGPGKAANAGGVGVSGMERTQNASMQQWSLKRVDEELQQMMKDIHERCIKHVKKQDGVYPYRAGANIYAFKKLAETLLAYGLK
jgi:glutamate dehydrogenase (NADP+)